MPKLKLVKGGNRPPSDQYDALLDLIFQALPADTYVQITTRVNAMSHLRYHAGQVKQAITHLRKHAAVYGWTVPHAQRGNTVIKEKFFAAVQNDDGSWQADPGMTEKIYEGNRGTLSEMMTKANNNAIALDMFGTQSTPAVARLLRRIAREQRHVAVQIQDLIEELGG